MWLLPTAEHLLLALTITLIGTVLLGAGAALGGKKAVADGSALWLGWGALILCSTIFGAAFHAPISWTYLPIIALGLYGLWQHRQHLSGWGIVLLVGTPLIVLASMSSPVMWDDFAHRLGSAKFLWEHNSFPRPDLPPSVSGLPGYPYGLSFIGHAASVLLNTYAETAMAAFASIQLLAFGWLAMGMAGVNTPWPRAAGAVLASVVLNPMFNAGLAFSGYNDIPTALATAVFVAQVYHLWQALPVAKPQDLWRMALNTGLVACVIVGQKQMAIILPALVALGVLALAWPAGLWRKPLFWQVAALVGALPVLQFAVWKWYVGAYIPGGDLVAAENHIALWAGVLAGIGQQVWEQPLLFVGHLFVLGLAVENYFRPLHPPHTRTLLALAVPLLVGYAAFLWLAYMLAFSQFEALRAASFERYSQHAAWAAWLLCVVVAVPWLAGRGLVQKLPRVAQNIALALAVLAPVAMQPLWLVATPEGTQNLRYIAQQLNRELPAGSRVVLYDPLGNGYAHTILEYDLGQKMVMGRFVSSFHPVPPEGLVALLERLQASHMLVLSIDPTLQALIPQAHIGQLVSVARQPH